jgi:threonine/homoserine/homoserine lactone efflux protein
VFATGASLFVVTPGLGTALVTRNALTRGPRAAWFTTIGMGLANLTYAVGSALGLSVIVAQWPGAYPAISAAGAAVLAVLGVQTIRTALGRDPSVGDEAVAAAAGARHHAADFTEGLVTNLLNPPVLLFYLTYVPPFVRPGEPYFPTYMGLALVHIAISLVWLTAYGASVGRLGAALRRPRVRQALELLTGSALLALAFRAALT